MKFAIIAGSLILFATYAVPCTTLSIPQSSQKWILKSYDWHQSHGSALVNPRGLKKKAFHLRDLKLAKWTSKYGSLTFNQHGREMPLGGINEAGLNIEIMWLTDTEYGTGSSGEFISELQWIQYHLDRFSLVKEVVESAQKLGISSLYAKVHFMVCDLSNECAVIEFLDGKVVVHTGKDLPSPVLTNNSYESSYSFLKGFTEFGGKKKESEASSKDSLDRFVRASLLSKRYQAERAAAVPEVEVFAILTKLAQGDYTKLNVAYDRAASLVYFRTLLKPGIKSIDLTSFNFACRNGAKILNLNAFKEGDVSRDFEAYTTPLNKKLVEEGLTEISAALPEGAMKKLVSYPESLVCEE